MAEYLISVDVIKRKYPYFRKLWKKYYKNHKEEIYVNFRGKSSKENAIYKFRVYVKQRKATYKHFHKLTVFNKRNYSIEMIWRNFWRRIEKTKKQRDSYKNHKQRTRELQKIQRKTDRLIVMNHYCKGVIQCQCCGELQYEFLTIHHKFGNGNVHRKQLNGMDICHWLILNNFPSIIEILCFNCNSVLGIYGYCPHKMIITKQECLLK